MGGMELLILLAIIMLFFGAKRVPELGRSLGRSMREFRKGASEEDAEAGNEVRGEKLREQEELPRVEEAAPHPTEARGQPDHEDFRAERAKAT